MKGTGFIVCGIFALSGIVAAEEAWDLPPISYSQTPANDRIAQLVDEIKSGKNSFPEGSDLDLLRFVLKVLEIPEESQILVFSKTSAQNFFIGPKTPRSLFFNENSYVGYVVGGAIEVITHDPVLGVVFYVIEPAEGNRKPVVIRDSSSCLNCHATRRTESVPGMTVRSVHPDETGQTILPLGTSRTDHRSPISDRWGGYYVTGRSALPHFGNQTFVEDDGRQPAKAMPPLDSVRGKIDPSKYLRDTSDIVALTVLEYQCHMHNLMTAASMEYRRAYWMKKSFDPDGDPDQSSVGELADAKAEAIVDTLLFKDEAPLGDGGIEGDPAYQDVFANRFPKTKTGHSLADFQLNSRMFKYRCSYMIYSEAFKALPERVKIAVLSKLKSIMEAKETNDDFPDLKLSERAKISEILRETVPGY